MPKKGQFRGSSQAWGQMREDQLSISGPRLPSCLFPSGPCHTAGADWVSEVPARV